MTPVLTLLSDFGRDDPYLAELKAALYAQWQRFPDLVQLPAVVDVCHSLPAGDVAAAAWFVARIHEQFPPGTVHLAVVDPGVGTDRPAVGVAAREQYFVGPGNGIFSALASAAEVQVVRLDNPLYHRSPQGGEPAATFHGRDIFAPVAAHLAVGVPLTQVGSPATVTSLAADVTVTAGNGRQPAAELGVSGLGFVVWIDRFGNAITDVRRDCRAATHLSRGAEVRVGEVSVTGPCATYAAGPERQPFWYWGSGGTLELALRGRSAAAAFGWYRGLAVTLPAP